MKFQAVDKYKDILDYEYEGSHRENKMSMVERGAQFSPFAALTGYEKAIYETGRLTCEKKELSQSDKAKLDEKLTIILNHLDERPTIKLVYFIKDPYKSGGSYETRYVKIKKVDMIYRNILLENRESIKLDDILDIECEVIDKYYGDFDY